MLDLLSEIMSHVFPDNPNKLNDNPTQSFREYILNSEKDQLEWLITEMDIGKHIISGKLSKKITDQLLNYFAKYDYIDFVTLLLNNGADPNASYDDISVIARSTRNGNLHLVKLLLERGAAINLSDIVRDNSIDYDEDFVYTDIVLKNPLSIAALHGHFEIIRLLIDNGADLHLSDNALRCSVIEGHYEIVKFLLEQGAKIINDSHILINSIASGNVKVVKLLLENGANIHAHDDYALMLSARYGVLETTKLLLQYGANVHAQNNFALQLSMERNHSNIVALLLDHGAVDQKTKEKLNS